MQYFLKSFYIIFFIPGNIFFTQAQQKSSGILTAPAENAFSMINEKGVSILPSGRYVTPAGKTIRITHDPFGMAISPDGKTAVTLHNGVFTIINLAEMHHTRVPAYDSSIASPLSKGSFLGVAFSPDSKKVFLSAVRLLKINCIGAIHNAIKSN